MAVFYLTAVTKKAKQSRGCDAKLKGLGIDQKQRLGDKAYLTKKQNEKDSETGDDIDADDSQMSTVGPFELIEDPVPGSEDSCCCHSKMRKRTKEKVYTMEDSGDDIISVHDASGCIIQFMHNIRKHYHNFRRYTFNEPTCWFDN